MRPATAGFCTSSASRPVTTTLRLPNPVELAGDTVLTGDGVNGRITAVPPLSELALGATGKPCVTSGAPAPVSGKTLKVFTRKGFAGVPTGLQSGAAAPAQGNGWNWLAPENVKDGLTGAVGTNVTPVDVTKGVTAPTGENGVWTTPVKVGGTVGPPGKSVTTDWLEVVSTELPAVTVIPLEGRPTPNTFVPPSVTVSLCPLMGTRTSTSAMTSGIMIAEGGEHAIKTSVDVSGYCPCS